MADAALADLIREVLAEELARIKAAPTRAAAREELVRITSDADLQDFARHMLSLTADPASRQAIEQGQIVFKLANRPPAVAPATAAVATRPTTTAGHAAMEVMERGEVIEQGFVCERRVDRFAADVRRVVLGKKVKLTPLARDRLRQRGIAIERMDR